MVKNLFKDYIYPIAVFSGGMVGVGFLSLPFIAMKSGFFVMLGYFVLLTILILFINSIFCEISLKTPDFKRFPGFVRHYLGKWAGLFTMISIIIGTFGVLLAYLVVAGNFLTSVFQPIFHGQEFIYVFIFFIVVSAIVYFDIKVIARIEFWVIALLFFSLVLVLIEGFSKIKISNIFSGGNFSNLFLPYGPLLFALWGVGLIPETEEMIRGKKGNLKKIIFIATLLISVFYFLFTFLILGITGSGTTEVALTGIKDLFDGFSVVLAMFIGVAAVFAAFITQGIIFKKTLMFDLGIKHWQAFVMTCFTPMIIYLLGLKSFISIISLTGGILLGIDGILILLMYKKIGGKNILIYPLSLVFLFGVIYEIIYFIK